jgi:hypothetical protein
MLDGGLAVDEEFKDIPISNVEIIFSVFSKDGEQFHSTGIQYSRPLPLTVYGIWALRQGIPVGVLDLMQQQGADPAPYPDCFQILIATDEGAMWGRKCPHCGGYWRTASPGLVQTAICCYCGGHAEADECLSDAQRVYVEACCALCRRALDEKREGRFTIPARNMLEGIEITVVDGDKPEFFVEKGRQTKFSCTKCGNRNDILGRFGYCCSCGTRNDLAMFETDVGLIRSALNNGGSPSTALKEAVDAFDTIGRNYARQLLNKVPMTSARRVRWEKANFAQLIDTAADLQRDFDIDILSGLNAADASHANLMFHRRHLFTHRGGIVDAKYLEESGDRTVQMGQLIRETNGNAHHLLSILMRISRNLHQGYHSIIPTHQEPIRHHQEHLARLKKAKDR